MKYAKKHTLYVDIGNEKSGEKIWLDEYQNYGIFVLLENDVIYSLILKPSIILKINGRNRLMIFLLKMNG